MAETPKDPNALPHAKEMGTEEYAAFNQFLGRRGRVPTNGELAAAVSSRECAPVARSFMGGTMMRGPAQGEAPAVTAKVAPSPAEAVDPNAVVNAKNMSDLEFKAAQEYLRAHRRMPTVGELARAVNEGKTRFLGHSPGGTPSRGVM
jgi:hypothetical protein